MAKFVLVMVAAMLAVSASAALAGDAEFLAAFAGHWVGRGKVRIPMDAPPINVSCSLTAVAAAAGLSMDGRCRALVVVTRRIGMKLEGAEGIYAGVYTGSGTGPAGLSGIRAGNAFEFAIRWAKTVNGDRDAHMRVELIGEKGMRMTTIDVDPKTGKDVVTSQIDFDRR